MARTVKMNNMHKPHPTHCAACGRALPRRAYRTQCATCIKAAQGKGDAHKWRWQPGAEWARKRVTA